MKKFLALSLCALMVLTMSAVVFAAEDNAFEYNFEDDTEGDFIAIDNSIKFYPKQGKVEIVKFDGSMVAKISQLDLQDIGGQMDTYADFVAGDVYFRVRHPGQNLDRARVQFKLCSSIETRESQVHRVLEKL